MDPPYEIKHNLYGKKGKLHKQFDHDDFASDCNSSQMNMLVSYNSDQLVKDRFQSSKWNAGEFDLTYTMRSVGTYMRDQKDRKELMLLIMTYELKDWLNSINLTKENLLETDPTSKNSYPPYIINRCLSGHLDCVLFVNEMNKYHFLDKDLQYSFI